MLRNCLEEDVCLYRPNARWGGEFEWLKTLQGPLLENCRKQLNLRVRKPLKKSKSNSTYITTCCLGGFQELQHIRLSDKTGTLNGTDFYGQMKLKKIDFLQQTLKIGLVNTGIKSTPCVQWNILLYFLCCGPIFLLEVLDILFRHMASWILSNTNR